MLASSLQKIINTNGYSPQDWKNILSITSSNSKE